VAQFFFFIAAHILIMVVLQERWDDAVFSHLLATFIYVVLLLGGMWWLWEAWDRLSAMVLRATAARRHMAKRSEARGHTRSPTTRRDRAYRLTFYKIDPDDRPGVSSRREPPGSSQ